MTRHESISPGSPARLAALRPLVICHLRADQTHAWGEFTALLLGPRLLCRSIRFYRGGRTSIHRHPVAETLLVQLGIVEIRIGRLPTAMRTLRLHPGELVRIPANAYHCTRCVKPISTQLPFASAIEWVAGSIRGGKYRIGRTSPAIPARHPRGRQ